MFDVVSRITCLVNWTTPPPASTLMPMPDRSRGLCHSKPNMSVSDCVAGCSGGGGGSGAGAGAVPSPALVLVVVVVVVVVVDGLSGGLGGVGWLLSGTAVVVGVGVSVGGSSGGVGWLSLASAGDAP